ncbi:hypothetical protein [Microvirga splendida]|uniref:Uncharacterized protein n=1 Tax=Microvirga splendida TaxID=2795727 RepID=A0ABS0XVH0_9HYPH|nr:hypothetical protein [Microvirga splendida]MBJ6124047.1 hypothetical protein [Microvirga splendida]
MAGIFDNMRDALVSANTVQIQQDTLIDSSQVVSLNDIPPAILITVATFNHYDNGKGHKGKWSSARYAMNVQFFTQTQAFTPSPALSAWSGTVQLHDPGFWMSYVDHKASEGKIDIVTHHYLKEQYKRTVHEYPDNALMGTFTDKRCGTNYSWPYFLRFWYDQFEGANLEVHLDAMLPTIIAWEEVKPAPDKKLPIIRARYNPLGLWKGRGASLKKGKLQ